MPTSVKEWVIDEPDQEFYLVAIMQDKTVMSACGRYAQGSGSKSVSWESFMSGEMNTLVERTMGKKVLGEVLNELKKRSK